MAEPLSWYLANAGQVATGVCGANIPSTILWEQLLPSYDPKANVAIQFLEAVIAMTGQILMTAIMAETLNPFLEDFNITAIYLIYAPYFMQNALQKTRRVSRAISNEIAQYMPYAIPVPPPPLPQVGPPPTWVTDDTNPGLSPLEPPKVDSVPFNPPPVTPEEPLPWIDPNSGNICNSGQYRNGQCVVDVDYDPPK